MTNKVKPRDCQSRKSIVLVFQVPGVPANSSPCTQPSTGEKFIISLERVMIAKDEVRGAVLSVQDFVKSLVFTQRVFFADSGIVMLADSAAFCQKILPPVLV